MKLIPGRFIKKDGLVLRLRTRSNGCEGCCLNNPYSCTAIVDNTKMVECIENNIIYTKP